MIKLGDENISYNSRPYVIAEIGVNHENSIDKAIELIDLAKSGGASAVKFQSYKANTLASQNSPAYWDTSKEKTLNQYQLFKKYDHFAFAEYKILADHCKKVNIAFSSTPFDEESVDYLENLVSFYKIASSDITCKPLLQKIGSKQKPVIISTGCSNYDEIDFALKILMDSGVTQIAILHCILNYPTLDKNANLEMIHHLKSRYSKNIIGYSDHTLPDEHMTNLTTSYLLGARIIEKHFTDDKTLPGNDHYHAMDSNDLLVFNNKIDKILEIKGEYKEKLPIPEEEKSRLNARRSIIVKQKLEKGHLLTKEDLTYKRPGTGISPMYIDEVISKTLNKSKNEDSILFWEDIES